MLKKHLIYPSLHSDEFYDNKNFPILFKLFNYQMTFIQLMVICSDKSVVLILDYINIPSYLFYQEQSYDYHIVF